MSSKNKRKGDDIFSYNDENVGPTVVVVGDEGGGIVERDGGVSSDDVDLNGSSVIVPEHSESANKNNNENNNNHNTNDIDGIKTNLRTLQEMYEKTDDDDPMIAAISAISMSKRYEENEELLLEESNHIQAVLNQELREAKEACQKESSVLQDLANQIKVMQQRRNSLVQNMHDLDVRQVELQRKIEKHVEETSQEIDMIDVVEEERKRQVPRLKTQLSLYASTTGIKWDFADTTTLSGAVVSYAVLLLFFFILYFLSF